jgi:uncharacterized protein
MRHRSISADTGIASRYWKGSWFGLRKRLGQILFLAAVSLIATFARAVTPQDLLAHPPTKYFNDYADVIQPSSATYLNDALATFERDTSNQVVVVVFPEWPAELAFDDYAQDLFRAAKIGQQGKDNGVLVLVSIKEHKIRIHTGRGLEGALPDALCIRIIRENFAPQFQTGNYDQGFRRGLAAVLAAARGEYRGDGKTVAQKTARSHELNGWVALAICILPVLFFVAIVVLAFRKGHMHRIRGSAAGTGERDTARSSDSGSSSGDSGFSGGGGDSGGGGASGDW